MTAKYNTAAKYNITAKYNTTAKPEKREFGASTKIGGERSAREKWECARAYTRAQACVYLFFAISSTIDPTPSLHVFPALVSMTAAAAIAKPSANTPTACVYVCVYVCVCLRACVGLSI